MKKVSFVTQCYGGDFQFVLDKERIKLNIENNNFQFNEIIVIINISDDYYPIIEKCKELKKDRIISDYYLVSDYLNEIHSYYKISESSFNNKKSYYINLYNLSSIYLAKSDYIVFYTGDSICVNKSKWISDSMNILSENRNYIGTNLKWSNSPITEHCEEIKDFYLSNSSFSDQNYMIDRTLFLNPDIIKYTSDKDFPHGDTFEMRIHGYMKKNNYLRCIYKHGQYEHKNFF